MKAYATYWRVLVTLIIAITMWIPSSALLLAGPSDLVILPPDSPHYGATYGEWGGRWWQWAYAQPVPVNPVVDPTGEHCAQGQSGPVWFLAGTLFQPGGEPAPALTRNCTVPAGKALFFPVFNSVWITLDEDTCREHQCITEQLDLYMGCLLAGVGCPLPGTTLEVTVDGVVVDLQIENGVDSPYRVVSPDFDAVLPPNNIAGIPSDDPSAPAHCPVVEGNFVCSPSVTDGIYLMLAPPSVGEHTIQIKAAAYFDVTYNLTVASDDQEAPTCSEPVIIPGPPRGIKVTVQETGSGLAQINVVTALNAAVDTTR